MADRMDSKEFLVDVDSKILKVDPTDDEACARPSPPRAWSSLARSPRVSWFG
jgi:hypothetical protein